MKTNLAIPQLVLLCVAVLIGTLPLLGHDKAADQAPYDAIAAAPDNHKVVFENEKVRVLEVTIKTPAEKSRFMSTSCSV